ncbi:YCF48-related protein [Hydrocarboniphaga sp.]|uniref:WD40/YVTN/BNR-like repeat-containing protein n=1 Tax=Hydrocarboniphaga sp. TaxID=2033016 RepID=UPI00262E0781|nr:YCF48-related protein [Hydrocarboniphaga sp.]
MVGIAGAGDHLVAVGLRGVILYSPDDGRNWQQSRSPVSVDLVAVTFPTPELGWAVGHQGVILHSVDGGRSWKRQLSGKQIKDLFLASTPAPQAASTEGDADQAWLAESLPTLPLMDVWFQDARTGYAIGAFNLLLRTDDGGEHWAYASAQIDNPDKLHLYSIRGDAHDLYIAGERGLVLRLDPADGRFKALPSPYRGTFFGIALNKTGVLTIFGMRGNAYRSRDRGQTWEAERTKVQAGLVGGSNLEDGRAILVSQTGQVLIESPDTAQFQNLEGVLPLPYASLVITGNQIVLAGMAGLRLHALPAGVR